MDLQAEADFFRNIAPRVRELVVGYENKPAIAKHKDSIGDYATEVDIASEKLIVAEIQKRFPGDAILAEEEFTDTAIGDSRIWIIDPICGTANLGRGLKTFCTNIALADKRQLIASCVVDHSQIDYFWSVGNGEVHINDTPYVPKEPDPRFGTVIDVDLGSLGTVTEEAKKNLAEAALRLLNEPGVSLQSLNSSLGFAYTAVGKINGFINTDNHPWDICASSFLIQQSGGVITAIDGSPWQISSVGAIAASDRAVYDKLLTAYSANKA